MARGTAACGGTSAPTGCHAPAAPSTSGARREPAGARPSVRAMDREGRASAARPDPAAGLRPADAGARRDSALLMGAHAFYKISAAVLAVVLSRFLAAHAVGLYFFSLSVAATLSVVVDLNLNNVLMRRVATAPAQAGAHLSYLLGLRLAAAPVCLLLVLVVSAALAPELAPLVLLATVAHILDHGYHGFGFAFIGLRRVSLNVAIGVPVQLLFLALVFVGLLLSPTVTSLLTVHVIRSVVLITAAAAVTSRFLFPVRLGWDDHLLLEGRPFFLLLIVSTVYANVDSLLLSALLDFAQVAHYQLAIRLVLASFFIANSVSHVLFPRFASGGPTAENRRLLVRVLLLLLGAGSACGVTLMVSADQVCGLLYGPLGAQVAPVLARLALLCPMGFIGLPLAIILQALRRETATLFAFTAALVAFVAGNTLAVPRYGLAGAAAVALASTTLHVVLLMGVAYATFRRAGVGDPDEAPPPPRAPGAPPLPRGALGPGGDPG